MANLTAVFELVDRISDRLDAIANRGSVVVDSLENAGDTIDQTFDGAISAADGAVSAVDGYSQAIGEAATQTDFWTDAVGNYDKSALEAIYTTEELVEQGFKTAEALEREADIMEACDKAAKGLSKALDDTSKMHDDCSDAMEKANKVSEEIAKNDKVSAKAKENLEAATEEAAQAFEELERAQEAAQSAMDEYDALLASGTASLDDMENAAEKAAEATDRLTAANERASSATEELSNATETASEEVEKGGKEGTSAIEGIASALAAAGITQTIKEIATEVYDLADGFSEAEKVIKVATGATGDDLDGLMESAQRVYANSNAESLEEIASGMASISKATRLTGEELEETTDKAYKMQDLLGYDMAESARTADALMKNFNISAGKAYDVIAAGAMNGADKNGDLLDILNEYAAQYAALGLSADEFISSLVAGADAGVFSVDKVGDAVKEFNIRAKDGSDASAEAFENLGMNAEIMTSRFAAGGDTASEAFFQVVNALEAMDDPVQKNATAVALFGTMYEDLEAQILPVLSSIEGGTLDTNNALEIATEGAGSMGDAWQEAGNSVSTAFTNAVQPSIDGISRGFAGVVKGIGDFLNEHPAVVKAVTAIGIGVGVVVAGIAGVTFVTTVAIPAVTAFGVALNTALGPIGWVALAITGIVAAGTALVAMMSDTEDETANMTAVTRKQYYELQDLNAEYDKAVEKYGENSEEALRLQYQIDDLSEAFENNRQTLEEFEAEVENLCTGVNELWTEFDAAIAEINASETGTLALIQKYEDLTEKATLTAGEQKQLEAVTKSLADAFPDLSENIDDATFSAEKYVEAIKKAAADEAQAQREAEAQEAYTEALKKRLELDEEIKKAEENLRLSQEADDNAAFLSDQWFYDKTGWLGMWATQTNEYQDALDELLATEAENEAQIAELEQGFENLAKAEEEAANKAKTYEEATDAAFEKVKDKVDELILAYDEAYQAAYDSFQGQFGLFDEAAADMEATVVNAQTALDSQLAYWEAYAANIDVLKNTSAEDLGITQENYDLIMAQVQDGSEQAAGLAASMVEAINNGDEEAVALLAETAGQIQAKQEEIAANTANWQTNFDAQMQAVLTEMEGYVKEFGFEDEAAQAAESTMSEYAASIRAGKNEAVTAAEEVAAAVERAIANANATLTVKVNTSSTVPGHAKGTTDAEDVFVAGEDGPELIVGAGGSTVFPNSETERIIAAVSEPENNAVKVVNEYEPTGFISKLENAMSKMVAKLSAIFDRPIGNGTVELEAYAVGTTSSDDNFIAGENGPELILDKPDSTVFPASETEKIVDAIGVLYNQPENEAAQYDYNYDYSRSIDQSTGDTIDERAYSYDYSTAIDRSVGDTIEQAPIGNGTVERGDSLFVPVGENNGVIEDMGTGKDASTRKILLEIAGKGNIELSGGKPDKESLLAFLYEYLKPVLSEILTQEIYEEGDLSYDY